MLRLNAPTVMPTHSSVAPNGPSAKSGVMGIVNPAAAKYASSQRASWTKGRVKSGAAVPAPARFVVIVSMERHPSTLARDTGEQTRQPGSARGVSP